MGRHPDELDQFDLFSTFALRPEPTQEDAQDILVIGLAVRGFIVRCDGLKPPPDRFQRSFPQSHRLIGASLSFFCLLSRLVSRPTELPPSLSASSA